MNRVRAYSFNTLQRPAISGAKDDGSFGTGMGIALAGVNDEIVTKLFMHGKRSSMDTLVTLEEQR
jgi:hypothetical protein